MDAKDKITKSDLKSLVRDNLEINRKIASNPAQPMKERKLAEKKIKTYLELLGELST